MTILSQDRKIVDTEGNMTTAFKIWTEQVTALDIIVRRTRKAMDTKVCSVFLLDNDLDRYVLMATEGLNKASVGRVSLALGTHWDIGFQDDGTSG